MNIFNKLNSLFVAPFICAIMVLSVASADSEIPSLEELKRLHIEGTNGQYSLDKLNSIYASGRILHYGDDETTERKFRVYKKKPNKYRSHYETRSAKNILESEIIFDGENAVRIFSQGGVEVYRENLEGDELDSIQLESRIEGPFLSVMEENNQYLNIVGYDYIEGEKCILLSIDERSKYPYRNIWISTDNYQEIKHDRFPSGNDEGNSEEVFYRNFKYSNGILFASRMDKFVNGRRNFTMFIDNFNVNYGLYDSLFEQDGSTAISP